MPHIAIIDYITVHRHNWLIDEWHKLIAASTSQNLFFQSPGYFDHLAASIRDDKLFVWIATSSSRKIVGLIPLRKTKANLDFEVKGKYLLRFSLNSITLLGCDLFTPELFAALFQKLTGPFSKCDVIEIGRLDVNSPLWTYIQENLQTIQKQFILYVPGGERSCQMIAVPASYEDYLAIFRKKKRYNLERQVRLMQDWSKDSLSLYSVKTWSDLPILLKAFQVLKVDMSIKLNGIDENVLFDLAGRNLIHSYVLQAGERPCAVAFGTIYQHCLIVHIIKHDKQLDYLSPGTVLHVLMMKDIIQAKLVKHIDYGFGEPKISLNTHKQSRVNAFLMRKTFSNWFILGAHMLFQGMINGLKNYRQ